MPVWDDFITERDRQVYAKAGNNVAFPYGRRPAVLVIDVTYAFVGDTPEPILDSIEKFHNSCGEEGWAAVAAIRDLLDVARSRNLPIFYTDVEPAREDGALAGMWRNSRGGARAENTSDVQGGAIVADIAPQARDFVVTKSGPSAFFGTSLASYLNQLRVDTLLVTGTTTSGCVRASVVDAFSYGWDVKVVEEGTFDRGQASHAINLFDMDAKYADVVPLQEVRKYVEQLPTDLFEGLVAPATGE